MTKISEAESRIMEALWRRGPLVVEDIVAEVAGPQQWSDRTVKSLIGRMLNKRTIESTRKEGRTYYRPLVAQDDYMMAESQSFLDRIFGGKVAPFVSQFAERQKLSAEDVAQLKALIERLDDDE